MTEALTPPPDLDALAGLSARIGADPMLVQAAGGNSSVKDGAVMWIKASGLWLAEARARNVFVPVDWPAMRAAIADPAVDADRTAPFVLGGAALRPSIETSLHAVFSQRIVIHVHCVNTLAHAVRKDAAARLPSRMAGFDWCLVPYVKPGATLADHVRQRLGPDTGVVVLTNHGLIVAADSVPAADTLLSDVVRALTVAPAAPQAPDIPALAAMAGAGWQVPAADAPVHQLALTPQRLAQATGGSLYPDHVIFCGIGVQAVDRAPAADTAPPFVLVPGKGALMRADITRSAQAMMNGLGDVLVRLPPDAEPGYLTFEQNVELLDWDAEAYRRQRDA